MGKGTLKLVVTATGGAGLLAEGGLPRAAWTDKSGSRVSEHDNHNAHHPPLQIKTIHIVSDVNSNIGAIRHCLLAAKQSSASRRGGRHQRAGLDGAGRGQADTAAGFPGFTSSTLFLGDVSCTNFVFVT